MTETSHLYRTNHRAELARICDQLAEDLERDGAGFAKLQVVPNHKDTTVIVRIDCETTEQWNRWVYELSHSLHCHPAYRIEPMIWPTLTVWILPRK